MTDSNRETLARIGNLSVAFATVECELVDCFASLVNSTDINIGEAICDRLSFTQTVDLLSGLVKLVKSENCATTCKGLAKRLRAAASTRNDILHSSWEFLPEDGNATLFQRRARRRDNDSYVHSTADLIQKLTTEARKMFELAEEVFDFSAQHLR